MNKTDYDLRRVQAIHQETAESIVDRRQIVISVLILLLIVSAFIAWKTIVATVLMTIVTAVYAAIVILKLFLMNYALKTSNKPTKEYPPLPKKIPMVTVLGPHYLEGKVLARWVKNISRLNWPKSKLEVLLLIREHDEETIEALRKIELPENFRVIWLEPKDYGSKPAALNVGLNHAKGEYIALFDSENGPEPDQIDKQVKALKASPEHVVFAQSYPVVSNYETERWWQNILPKIEAAEYASYYNLTNRSLIELGLFSPLPGNSVMFKKDALLAVGKYDRFNKTEDADIAVRLARRRWKGVFVPSETTEESPTSYRDWEGRRRRWTHGFMQTWLVPMRHPIQLWKDLGTANFAIFQLIIGGSPFVQIVNPLLWVTTAAYWISLSLGWETGVNLIRELYPWPVMYLAVLATILGILIVSFYSIIAGIMKREMYANVWVAYMFLPYNFLISVASYKAIYDLITKSEWHKTSHENEGEQEEVIFTAASSQETAS